MKAKARHIAYYYSVLQGPKRVSYRRSTNARRFGQLLASLNFHELRNNGCQVYLKVDYGIMDSDFGRERFTNEGKYTNRHDLKQAWLAFKEAT